MLARRFRARRMIVRFPRPPPFRWPPRGSAGASRIARCSRCTAGRWKRSSRICSRARKSSPCRGTTRRRPSSRRCSRRAAWALAADGLRGDGRPARAHALGARREGFALAIDRGAQHDRARSRRRSRMRASCRARPACRTHWFEHDGQITKRDIRAVTLCGARAAPRRTLWDFGAGSGSIAIEWMLADPANRAVAVERSRSARAAHRAQRLALRRARTLSDRRRARRPMSCGSSRSRRDLHRRRRDPAHAYRTRGGRRCAPAAGW